jgi:hypothetical protein
MEPDYSRKYLLTGGLDCLRYSSYALRIILVGYIKDGLNPVFFFKIIDMKVLFLETPLMFSLIPRHYPKDTDVLTLVLRNEYTSL